MQALKTAAGLALAALCVLVYPLLAATPAYVLVPQPDGSTARYVPEAPAPPPATGPATVPVVTPPVVTVDPNTVNVAKGADLAAALAKMADGKTLALERGGDWRGVVVPWRWSRAKLVAVGTGADPVVGGVRAAAPGLTDVTVTGGLSVVAAGEVGVDLRADRLARWTLEDVTVAGGSWCYAAHAAKLDAAPDSAWLSAITYRRCRAKGARAADPADTMQGQGWYVGNVDGLLLEDCHGDDCGGMANPNIFRHVGYVAAFNRRVTLRRCLATRASSYGWQVRADGATVEDCLTYDCGMGILVNGTGSDVRRSVVVRGHGHAPTWPYGKGGFDLHIGSGDVSGNVVLNGPQTMPAGWYQPPAFNLGYRETKTDAKTGKPTNQAWEWTKLDPATGKVRPLAKLGAGNVDRTTAGVATLDPDALCKLPPAEAAAKAMAAAIAK